jgi:hypothetical protein
VPVVRSVLLALAVIAAGCGPRAFTAVDAAAPAAPEAGGDTADGGAAVCPSPAGCNDDPTTSALAGTCTPSGDYWYCQCADGFSINPKTSLCRAGTACVAAAADSWDFRMRFDTTDCASRAATACDAPVRAFQTPLFAELLALGGPTCTLPEFLTVRVELVNGCPTQLEANDVVGASLDLDYLRCFADSLKGARFSCAAATDCFMAEWDDLLP